MNDEQAFNLYGFTNDENKVLAARLFRLSALTDGWAPDREVVDCFDRLEREGWKLFVVARENGLDHRYKFTAKISIWGPDGLQVRPPALYDWETLQLLLRRCNLCGATDVQTQRYSFAGRCCVNCLDEARRVTEKPGWDD